MDQENLDFVGALDAYVAKIEEFARERGDRVVFKQEQNGDHVIGIETVDGHPLSFSINYTP